MSILDYIQNKGAEAKYAKDLTEAENIFLKQKEAIQGIKDTQGLKEIVEFWERQKEINESMFETGKDKEIQFALYKQSKQFLNFIGNLLG